MCLHGFMKIKYNGKLGGKLKGKALCKQQFVINALSGMFEKHIGFHFRPTALYGVLHMEKKKIMLLKAIFFFYLCEVTRQLFCLVFHLRKIPHTLI